MKEIQHISDKIEKELDNAECYIMDALDQKEKDPILAETSFQLANERMADVNMLHSQVVRLIETYKKEKGEAPEHMKILYNILHKKHIEHAAIIKGVLSLYKET